MPVGTVTAGLYDFSVKGIRDVGGLNPTATTTTPQIDDYVVSVPEPTSMLLTVFGVLGVAGLYRSCPGGSKNVLR